MDSADEDDPMPLPINSPAAKSFPTRGCFVNVGNSCYLSSSLQLLLHVPNISQSLACFKRAPVASALQSVDEAHQLSKLVVPGPILQVLDKIAPNFEKNSQQDAHEFIILLFDKLIEEAGTVTTPLHYIFSSASAQLVSCENCYQTSSLRITFPLVVTVQFHGFNDLEEALKQNSLPESVVCTCAECGHGLKKKVHCLLRPANHLCLHIPRFAPDSNGNYVKSNSELHVNNSLKWCGYKYNLIGVIVHHGKSQRSGHYTAFCLDRSNVWYHFNDSKFTPINILSYLDSKECLQNAYIVLYQKEAAAGDEAQLQTLSQLMTESNLCEPLPTRAPRRKLLQDEQEIPPKIAKKDNDGDHNDDKELINQVQSLSLSKDQDLQRPKTTRSVCTQTYPIWSYEAKSLGDPERFKYSTGVTPGEFEVIYELLGGEPICSKLKYNYDDKTPLKNSTTIKVSLKSRLFLVLLRMRRGHSLQDICDIFDISLSHCSAIFYTWVRLLSITFKRLSKFMLVSAPKQNEKKPSCFLPFKNLKIVIDCAEFQIERSSNMQQQGNCYSEYKHFTSAKVCFAISCYGGISLVSDVFEGRISDKQLVLDMGLLDQLEKGDVIMADRGFMLEEECLARGLTLLKPPSIARGQDHLTPRQEVLTKSIACVRIYVEHVIGRVKNWEILNNRVELLLLPILPDMIVIASFIHNFSKSYIN